MEIGHFYDDLFKHHAHSRFGRWLRDIEPEITRRLSPDKNKLTAHLLQAYAALPAGNPHPITIKEGIVTTGAMDTTTASHEALQQAKPWRKGPWNLNGVSIDSEWDSRVKWNRLGDISHLHGKRILDIGCGNGYYGFRMLDAGAREVIGIDPGLSQVFQQLMVRKLAEPVPFWILPVGAEALPAQLDYFDTVFSMGVLYHRKSPVEHLQQIRSLLRPGGELIVETLVVDDSYGEVLIPEDRYAQMPNVWFIPSVGLLKKWLRRLKYVDIHLCDISLTTEKEQRKTSWVDTLSLRDFITEDRTVEGYPRPKRAIVRARRRA
ncbi:tRNA 5-methoxyuridine(34)/uridine 5-oxyacetic acid(34) synthase CmoB [Chitinivibrio alkaliphilus]|uniref:Methyltransferase n=1 Tax=Chitinivibrio alkaliphilus ACht1 TaxID=1313304 RepID=U7D8X3_9BACT|nr:tRNA 5-methoxyuridine(34)/uridine 5-oxyacetic acid(34) synthase CmoB [Chitinivibrio alkaliphilus]ERP39395.1 methyltransferase [Chitinivibrio alkaliphilus ACht1]